MEIITFGCRLNSYESEVIKKNLVSENYDLSDVVVINSCAVTNEAERKVKQKIRKINKSNPSKKIIVVGCAVDLKSSEYIKIPGVVKIIGNGAKLKPANYLSEEKIIINDDARSEIVSNFSSNTDRVRGFVQIQNGCNHDCTFCAITIARGKNTSAPIESIIAQINALVDSGCKEIVLTGVDITDYGKDLYESSTFSSLIRRIIREVPKLKRLRFSSIDVAEMDADVIDLIIYEKKLMPHLHISMQSGDDIILKRMKRRHTRDKVLEFCSQIRRGRPEVVFGADVIAGFPTETDIMFQNSIDLIKQANITYLHVFPYSKKDGTKAMQMPQLPREIIKERARHLIQLGEEQMQYFNSSQMNKIHSVILEKENIGRSENFALVKIKSQDLIKGEIYNTIIDGSDGAYLTGRLINLSDL